MVVSFIEQSSLEALENILELNMEYLQLACESEVRLHDSDGLGGGIFESAKCIHEGFIDKAFDIIHNIIDAVINFFRKIIDAIKSLFSKDKSKETTTAIEIIKKAPPAQLNKVVSKSEFNTKLNVNKIKDNVPTITMALYMIGSVTVSMEDKFLNNTLEEFLKHCMTSKSSDQLSNDTRLTADTPASLFERELVDKFDQIMHFKLKDLTFESAKGALKDKCNFFDETPHQINGDKELLNIIQNYGNGLEAANKNIIKYIEKSNNEFRKLHSKIDKYEKLARQHTNAEEGTISQSIGIIKTIVNKLSSFVTSVTSTVNLSYTNAINECRRIILYYLKAYSLPLNSSNESYYGYDDDFVYDFGF